MLPKSSIGKVKGGFNCPTMDKLSDYPTTARLLGEPGAAIRE
jgi:hypothetical protein